MPPTLTRRTRLSSEDSFYQNSFKQLSDIQQKQVGLIIGAAVADAAARSLDGYSASEVRDIESCATPADDPLVFANVSPKRDGGISGAKLRDSHSFTHQLHYELLRTMSAARGDFPVSQVQSSWIAAAGKVELASAFRQEHGTLLHIIGVLLPLPTIYPYASDATLRQYARPFAEFLTEPLTQSEADGDTKARAVAEREAAVDCALSTLSVALRCLQSNPDPVLNSAFMSIPGTAAIFPAEVAHACPQAITPSLEARMRLNEQVVERYKVHAGAGCISGSDARTLMQRPTLMDARVVQEGLTIAQSARSFPAGVTQAIRLGGPTCQRALLVGALLGARFGARRVPTEWLNATPDHKPVATMAIEVAQWSWNPPHR